MNYQKIHDKIINRARQRVLPDHIYTENHHVIQVDHFIQMVRKIFFCFLILKFRRDFIKEEPLTAQKEMGILTE